MATSPGQRRRSRGRPRIHKVAEDLKQITEQSKFMAVKMEDDITMATDFLGDEAQRWNSFKASEGLVSNSDVAKQLMDFWQEKQTEMKLAEIKKPTCDLSISVNFDTYAKFQAYKAKYNRTNDEVVKFFCQLDVEPGQNAIGVDIETMKTFLLLKIRMNLSSVQALNYLFDLHESSMKPKKEDLTTSNFDRTIRKALRDELTALVRDGILPSNKSGFKMPEPSLSTPHQSNPHQATPHQGTPHQGYSVVTMPHHLMHGVEVMKRSPDRVITIVPDQKQLDTEATKKRSRKSHPQRILMDPNVMNGTMEAEDESFMSMSADADSIVTSTPRSQTASSGIGGVVTMDDTEVMQYNYVINDKSDSDKSSTAMARSFAILSSSVTPTVANTSVSVSATSPDMSCPAPVMLTTGMSTQEQLNLDIAAIIQQNMQKPSTKELEAAGIFKVGNVTLVKDGDGSLTCPYCSYRTPQLTRLRRHVTLHTGKAYKCRLCDKSYTEESKLKEHVQVKHERSVHFVCDMCKREFTSKGGLKYHNKTMHKKDYSFWCEQCCKGFNQLQFYQTHMNKHNNATPYKCNVCSKEFSYLATLSMHRKTCLPEQVNNLSCEICCDTFENENDLKEHMGSEHCDVLTFRCGCGMEFRWRAAFDKHRDSCPSVEKADGSPAVTAMEHEGSDGFGNIQVTDVHSLFTESKSLSFDNNDNNKGTSADFDEEDSSDSVLIMNVETGNQAVIQDGNNISLLPEVLDAVSNTIHKCQFCTYTTSKMSHFKRHSMIHLGKKYKCQHCTKSFNELGKLKTHERSKHQGSAKYKCDKCSRTFSSKGGIMYHQQTKHNNSYKHRCEICEKGFNTIQHYVGHKNTHSGIRPHVCSKCGMGFAYPSVLTSHRKVCRGNNNGANISNGDINSLLKCSKCNEKFALKSSLEDHMQENHPLETDSNNRYMCECGEDFQLRALYYLHKESCSKSDKQSEITFQTVNDDDSDKNDTQQEEEEFQQISPEKFNSIVNQQPVFPS